MSKMSYEFATSNWFDNVENRPHPHPGLNWLTTMLYVPDVKKALEWYQKVFGIVPIFQLPDENGTVLFARMRYRGINFTLNKEGFFGADAKAPITTQIAAPFIFYLYVDDIETTLRQALENNGKLLEKPTKEFWGDLRARIEDPFGYIWDIATKIE